MDGFLPKPNLAHGDWCEIEFSNDAGVRYRVKVPRGFVIDWGNPSKEALQILLDKARIEHGDTMLPQADAVDELLDWIDGDE